MDRSRYKQTYGDFIGVDLSSDPSAVSRNRLAWSVNMWRDYESANGGCVETFPGYRAVARLGERVNGIYGFRTKFGVDYLIVHAGRNLYALEVAELAGEGGVADPEIDKLLKGALENSSSTGYLFNNNLYILDGKHYIEVKVTVDEVGISHLTAGEIDGYIPLTYFDGKPYEQRNMLSEYAYEVVLPKSEDLIEYSYTDTTGSSPELETRMVRSAKESNVGSVLKINAPDMRVNIDPYAFSENRSIETVRIECKEILDISREAFKGCKNLKIVSIFIRDNIYAGANTEVIIRENAFYGCSNLEKIYIYSDDPSLIRSNIDSDAANRITVVNSLDELLDTSFDITEVAENVEEISDYSNGAGVQYYSVKTGYASIGGESRNVVKSIRVHGDDYPKGLKVKLKVYPNHFTTVEGAGTFFEGNPDYKQTGAEAINGCTKCAVFDGRIFLTGNKALPNTVFYSQRNLTGVNDPTYFGAYNYINDGVGNVPNVELLATPSYLMVLKQDTVQDGSIYYHTPADNTHSDQVIRNLIPRIYPAMAGAAGVGSAGDTVPGATVCNFLDDPVFLSKRGLSSIGKEQLNLERTVTHRSSNVDRLLIKEDLAHAALAEWKGYLLILVNGNVYMADSRALAQHPDGSYQYEWFYLTGIGSWESYAPQYRYCTAYPVTDDGIELAESQYNFGRLADTYKISKIEGIADGEVVSAWAEGTASDGTKRLVEFFTVGEYLVEQIDDELRGEGVFHGADKMAVMGERLFFGTNNGYLLCVNSDMRDGEGIMPRDAYTFNGCAYESGCATRLDDCGQMGLAKCTIPGTAVAEFKMIPGSRCRINVSLNGRDFRELFSGAIGSTRFDFGDFDFSNFAFTENENNITVLREMTRNFIRKQYYIYSDGFKEPFGLCGLTYQYYVKGKIRR